MERLGRQWKTGNLRAKPHDRKWSSFMREYVH